MTRLLARVNERLDEIEAGPVMWVVTVFIASFIGALIWGSDTIVHVVGGVGIAWLIRNVGLQHSRTDEALDEADKAHKRVEAVEHHLTGLEPAGSGRHARVGLTQDRGELAA